MHRELPTSGVRMLLRRSCGLAIVLALLTLQGCSSSVPTTKDESPARVRTAAPEADRPGPGGAVAGYMKAFDSADPDLMRESRKFAVRDSIADGYLLHQTYSVEAFLDAGEYTEPAVITQDGEGYKSCSYEFDGSESCATFTKFKVKDGQVTEFLVDGKEPGPRLVVGDGRAEKQGGVEVELLSSYKSIQAESLVVTARVTTGREPADVELLSATYRAPNGKQRKATQSIGPETVDADSNAVVALVFAGVATGGRVSINICIDLCDRELSFNLNLNSD